jgi:hypothetical protein
VVAADVLVGTVVVAPAVIAADAPVGTAVVVPVVAADADNIIQQL